MNSFHALQGHKIYVLDIGIFAEQQGMPACNPDTTFRVDPITNVPFLHDDPQVRMQSFQHFQALARHQMFSLSARL